ncbi:MAG: energy transducer TonB [Pedobacter sp.]|nr:MAG: energy transducer TonB [Pedobacter sp.]
MKKTFSILLLLSLSFFAGAQELKKINKRSGTNYFAFKETYTVLKSNPEVKQGAYQKTAGRSTLKGQYDNGARTGIWEAFNQNDLEQKINFPNQEVLFAKPMKALKKVTILNENAEVETENQPLFIGGDALFTSILAYSIRYPAEAVQNHVQGKAILSAIITSDGKMVERKIVKGPGYGINEEALRVVELIPNDWIPLKVDGKAVSSRIEMEVSFTLGR